MKLKTKTQNIFCRLNENLTTFLYTLKEKTFFFLLLFSCPPCQVVKFSFKRQNIFWVLVFSFIYLVLVHATDKSFIYKIFSLD